MYLRSLIFLNKLLIRALRLIGKNGSALPGLVIERFYPSFLDTVLFNVQDKIILITGTNGKTTTTKMVVEGLRSSGSRVVTNSTGSNMTRGLISALVEDMTYSGSLKQADWFVFEMDEAYAPIFTKKLKPKLLLALNVLRDQLDRYGELDQTAKFIEETSKSVDVFVYNCLDPLLVKIRDKLIKRGMPCSGFGVSEELLADVLNEESAHGSVVNYSTPDVILGSVEEGNKEQTIGIYTNNKLHKYALPVRGFHNALNGLAVYATLKILTSNNSQLDEAMKGVADMPTPFGRGEMIEFGDKNVTVALVKNPSGLLSNLVTFVEKIQPDIVLFAINDNFADGRDVSWLWDVDFKDKIAKNTTIYTTGIRGYDMALRLKHDGFEVENIVGIDSAVAKVMNQSGNDIVIIPTYTALFTVRSSLSKFGRVPRIW
jgi:UDP-N-acetylmuramyl tripeptide synthase